jgi:hypothetical protein
MDLQEMEPLQSLAAHETGEFSGVRNELTLIYVRCDEVIVEGRHRKKLQGIESLSESISQLGVLQPIAITPGLRLICGERRLTAAIQAAVEIVPAVFYHGLKSQHDLILAEIMENSERVQPSYSDLADLADDLLPLAQEAARRRQAHQERDPELSVNLTQAGKALDQVAGILHVSPSTLNKVRKIVAAGREDCARFADLVEKMDRERKVNGVYNELLRQ